MARRIRKLSIWMISDLSRLISPPPPCSPPSDAANASAGSSITHADTMEPSHTERRWSIGQIPPVSWCRRRFVKTITGVRRLSIRPRDHAPADDEIVTVPHDRLTRGDRALGLVEHDLRAPRARRDDGRGRGTMAVTDSRLHAQWLARRSAGDEVHVRRQEPVALETAWRADGQAVGARVDVRHIQGAALPDAEPAPLTDRVAGDAGVGAEHATVTVDDRARPENVRIPAAQETAIVVVGHEADLLALPLVGRDEAESARVRADLLLVEIADGKMRRCELRLIERPEEIGLVLACVAPPAQEPAPARRVLRDARVMAGGHAGGVPGTRPREQRAVFEIYVAGHARHRRAAAPIRVGEGTDDRAVELGLHVQDVVRDAELARDAARVVHRLAAALDEERRRDRRIHASGHADDDARGHRLDDTRRVRPAVRRAARAPRRWRSRSRSCRCARCRGSARAS